MTIENDSQSDLSTIFDDFVHTFQRGESLQVGVEEKVDAVSH